MSNIIYNREISGCFSAPKTVAELHTNATTLTDFGIRRAFYHTVLENCISKADQPQIAGIDLSMDDTEFYYSGFSALQIRIGGQIVEFNPSVNTEAVVIEVGRNELLDSINYIELNPYIKNGKVKYGTILPIQYKANTYVSNDYNVDRKPTNCVYYYQVVWRGSRLVEIYVGYRFNTEDPTMIKVATINIK